MTHSKYPLHLRSDWDSHFAACGNFSRYGTHLQFRSIKRVECKNCLKIIAANVETQHFKPLPKKQVTA